MKITASVSALHHTVFCQGTSKNLSTDNKASSNVPKSPMAAQQRPLWGSNWRAEEPARWRPTGKQTVLARRRPTGRTGEAVGKRRAGRNASPETKEQRPLRQTA